MNWITYKQRETVILILQILIIIYSIIMQLYVSKVPTGGGAFIGLGLTIFCYYLTVFASFMMTLLWGVIQIKKEESKDIRNVTVTQFIVSIISLAILSMFAIYTANSISPTYKCIAFIVSGAILYDSIVNCIEVFHVSV